MSVDRRVRALASRIGVPLHSQPRKRTWTGRSLATDGRPDTDVIHDLAHWLVVPPSRRMRPDYGLGADPSSDARSIRRVGWRLAEDEEREASLLGILIERAIGMDWLETARDHNWEVILGEEEDDYRPLPPDSALAALLATPAGRALLARGLVMSDGSVPVAEGL